MKDNIESNKIEDIIEASNIESKWTNIQMDSQILSTFMSCPRKMDYVFNRHLVSISGTSKAIQKGQLSHIGLHAYWKSRIEGADYQIASEVGVKKAREEAPKFNNLDAEGALEVYKNLIEYFKYITSLTWIPLATEHHFKFIAYEDPVIRLRIILTGRIDLILRSPSIQLLPVDNKSEAERWFYSGLSNQFKIYALACKSNLLGVQRFGFQKTLEPKDKFKMELIPFDVDILDEFRNEVLPYYAKQYLIMNEEGYYPPRYSSCINGHFACQFSDKYNNGGICSVSRSIRDQKIDRFFTVGEPWDPADF